MSVFSVAVQTSAIMEKTSYYISYKNKKMIYCTVKNPSYTDTITTYIKCSSEVSAAYDLISEFIRAFAYTNGLSVSISPGFIVHDVPEKQFVKFTGGFQDRRRILQDESVENFFAISLIDTDDKASLLRLYTEAFSSSNVYLEILFYWHSIVYPSNNDDDAVKYIDSFVFDNKESKRQLQELNKCHAFGKRPIESLGKYIKDDIRHSLAHIVRKYDAASGIKVDSWEQITELSIVSSILQNIAKYKLDVDYNLVQCAGPEIFDIWRMPDP